MLKPLRNVTGLPPWPLRRPLRRLLPRLLPARPAARPEVGGGAAGTGPGPSTPLTWLLPFFPPFSLSRSIRPSSSSSSFSSFSSFSAFPAFPFVLLVLSILLAVAAGVARAEVRRYEVSADEMTRQAADHFPIRRCLLEVACVTLSEPKVRLLDGDPRIHLTTTVRPELGGERLDSGEVDLAGTPYYAPERGAFFLKGARITESRFPGLKPQQARTVSELASSLLAGALRTEPIYQLDEGDARQALARLVLRDIRVSKGRLLLVVGDAEP